MRNEKKLIYFNAILYSFYVFWSGNLVVFLKLNASQDIDIIMNGDAKCQSERIWKILRWAWGERYSDMLKNSASIFFLLVRICTSITTGLRQPQTIAKKLWTPSEKSGGPRRNAKVFSECLSKQLIRLITMVFAHTSCTSSIGNEDEGLQANVFMNKGPWDLKK